MGHEQRALPWSGKVRLLDVLSESTTQEGGQEFVSARPGVVRIKPYTVRFRQAAFRMTSDRPEISNLHLARDLIWVL